MLSTDLFYFFFNILHLELVRSRSLAPLDKRNPSHPPHLGTGLTPTARPQAIVIPPIPLVGLSWMSFSPCGLAESCPLPLVSGQRSLQDGTGSALARPAKCPFPFTRFIKLETSVQRHCRDTAGDTGMTRLLGD